MEEKTDPAPPAPAAPKDILGGELAALTKRAEAEGLKLLKLKALVRDQHDAVAYNDGRIDQTKRIMELLAAK